MKILHILFVLLSFVSLNAQKSADMLNLPYSKDKQQTLDLFLPNKYTKETPVIIMLHGGAWSMGGKEYTDKTSKDLRDRGFIVANVDYRYVSETVNYKNLLNDVDEAIKYVSENAKKMSFRTEGYHLAGISAGAHLSLLYSYTTTRNIKSVSALCAPSKFNDVKTFEHIEKLKLVQIISYLANATYSAKTAINSKFADISPFEKVKQMPTLLLHGTKDDLVDYQQSVDLYNQLQKKKIKSKLVTMEGKGHDVGMNQPNSEIKVLDEITNWIKTNQ